MQSTGIAIMQDVPLGYVRHGDLFGDFDGIPEWRWLLYANLLALVPLAGAVLLLWLPYQFYITLGAPLALPEPDWSSVLTVVVGIAIIIASAILHEGLHGLALRLMGYRPRLLYSRGFLLASVSGFITRRDYLIMVVTPITTMSVAGALLLLWLPVSLGQWLLVALLLNAAASIGDLAVASRVRRFSAATLFADMDGIKVFVPAIDHEP
jgi:hypothetical protein